MKYILILTVMLSACAGTYSRYNVATSTYPDALNMVANAANNDIGIEHLDKDSMTTKWEKVYANNKWEYHYRFVAEFEKGTVTAQCMVRDQSLGVDGKERPWYFRKCKGEQIMQLVNIDLDTLIYGGY